MRIARSRKVAALIAALAMAAAACGSDSDSEGASETSEASTASTAETSAADTTPEASNDTEADSSDGDGAMDDGDDAMDASEGLPAPTGDQTAKVMVLTDVTQGQIAYSAPETFPAVQAAFAGLPNVEVTVCDPGGDQNEYLNCQREAVDDGVNAVIVGWSAGGQAGEDTLHDAGIPVLGGPSDMVSKLSYSFSSGSANYVGLGTNAVVGGCSKLGILHLEGTDFLADMIRDGAESQGGEEVSRAAIPSNAPDLAPAIAKLLGDDADCIILSVSPPMVIQAMTAISQSGETPLVAATGAILPPAILGALGPLAEGIISVEPALAATDPDPVLAELASAVASFDGEAAITVQATTGFVAGAVLAEAISNVEGDVTNEAIAAQIDLISALDVGGIVPPVTVAELTNPALARFMSPWSIAYVIKDGVPERLTDFVSTREAIEG